MTLASMSIIFVIGYLCIALEHPLRIPKAPTALLTGLILWVLFAAATSFEVMSPLFMEHTASVAYIVFFLMGAMAIVELIDSNNGFQFIIRSLCFENKRHLLIAISFITFFLSSVLDNMTTAIVMASIIRRTHLNDDEKKLFAGVMIIAANAGGAWTPIGDITTTMLWTAGRISSLAIMKGIFIPSVISLIIPIFFIAPQLKGKLHLDTTKTPIRKREIAILILGILALVSVPVFKQLTGLPPFAGILFALSIFWVITEFMPSNHEKRVIKVAEILSKIDLQSVLFFLGILLAVASLDASGILGSTATYLSATIGNLDIIAVVIGLLSAIVDNVPLVAATIGMYPVTEFPMDHRIWELIAFTAGTGGSILIIGSAAGVAVMGILKIDFMWYMRKIAPGALIGYLAGAAFYIFL